MECPFPWLGFEPTPTRKVFWSLRFRLIQSHFDTPTPWWKALEPAKLEAAEYIWPSWSETVRSGPCEVGLMQPNPFGLFDMGGNVREWCSNAYDAVPFREPSVVRYPLSFVIRGGCYGEDEDYLAHREGDVGLAAPVVHALEPGSFKAWMQSQGKLGGQHKVPRLMADHRRFHELLGYFGLSCSGWLLKA